MTLHEARPEFVLESGDTASFIADIRVHAQTRQEVGDEVLDPELLDYHVTTREVVVVDAEAVGKTLDELDLPNHYGCFATGLTRAAIDLPLTTNLPLQKGDRLSVVGEDGNLNCLAKAIGFVERELETTDLAIFALGMIVGTLLGLITVALGNLSVGLGSAGGLLIVGIVIGYLSSVNPTFGRVPAAARYGNQALTRAAALRRTSPRPPTRRDSSASAWTALFEPSTGRTCIWTTKRSRRPD